MRLLYPRHGDERDRPGEAQQRSQRDRDPRVARGQYLSLHRLSQYRQVDQSRRRRHAGGRDMSDTGIGAPVRRKEDFRFLTGQGTYTDDINRPGQLHAYILRSPHAHARLKGIDIKAASEAAGVVAIYTGKDLAADNIGG